jgi:hypothetical protein
MSRAISVWPIPHRVYNVYIRLDKLDEMSNVVGTEIVEEVFNRQRGGKLDQKVEQQNDEEGHDDLNLQAASQSLAYQQQSQLDGQRC